MIKHLSKKQFLTIFLFISILVLLLIVVLAIKFPTSVRNIEQSSKSTSESEDINLYQGEFLSSKLPNQWSIIEFLDDSGMDSDYRTNSKYTGLTGFEILKEDTVIFAAHGTDGIGGVNVCEEVYKFNDTPGSYLSNALSFAHEQGLQEPTVVDLSNLNYEEFHVFSVKARIVDSIFYWLNSDSIPYCGIEKEIVNFNEPYFTIQESNLFKGFTYKVIINNNLTPKDLEALKLILKSLKFSN